MRIPILTLLLIVFVPHSGFAQDFKFAEEYPFKVGDNQGKVEISLHQTVLRRGESYGVNFRFINTTGSNGKLSAEIRPRRIMPVEHHQG